MNEYSANFMPDSNKKICTGCNDTGDGGDTESENVVEMITGKKKKSGFLGWIEDISKQSPLLTAIVILYLFQKYGISWVENLLGLSSK
jgi:hypothetical protein